MSVATTNPYANHSQLSPLESEVLWEYAKLADKLKRISTLARESAENPNEPLLSDLRELEKQMKLVYTMYRASVFNVVQAEMMRDEEQQARQEEQDASRERERTQYDSTEGESTIMY